MTRRRCDFFFDFRIILFESPYGIRMGFRMGVAWDFTEHYYWYILSTIDVRCIAAPPP